MVQTPQDNRNGGRQAGTGLGLSSGSDDCKAEGQRNTEDVAADWRTGGLV